MKAICLIIFLILFPLIATSQNNLLPIAKDGKWGLIRHDGTTVLPPVCDYIEYQQAGLKFVYDIKGAMGVLDANGTILIKPLYEDITFFSPQLGAFKLNDKWRLYNSDKELLQTDFDSIVAFENDILQLYVHDSVQFFSGASQKASTAFYASAFRYKEFLVAEKSNGLNDLLNLPGLNVVASEFTSIIAASATVSIIYFKDGVQLYNTRDKAFIAQKYDAIRYEYENWFTCKLGKEYFLLDALKGKTYKIPQTDEVIDITGNLMNYYLANKVGVWNLGLEKEILPPIYDGAALQNGFIYTQIGGNFGIISPSGKEIFPTEYSEISNFGNVFVISKGTKMGLATETGKIIEPCKYYKIDVFDDNVKCYEGKRLTTLSIDESGNVKDRTVYDEYMTVSFSKPREPRQSTQSLSFGSANVSDNAKAELNKLGWYQTKMQREENGVMVEYFGNWGMKNELDSIVIKARYKHIVVVPGTPYTIAYLEKLIKSYTGKRDLETITQKGLFYAVGETSVGMSPAWFHIVNHREKFVLGKEKFQSVQIEDFKQYELARAVQKTPVLIDSGGTVVFNQLSFYDYYQEGHLRICEGGEQIAQKRIGPAAMSTALFFRDMGISYSQVDPKKPFFSIKGGRWYFVNRRGEKTNTQPFDFIFPFVNNRSIVLRKGKWGVVDTNMTEIVPIVNQWVDRMVVNGDTFFRVTNGNNQKYFYQRSAGSYTKTDYSVFSNYINGLWFVKDPKSEKWGIVDTTLSLIMDFKIDKILDRYGNYTTVSIGDKSYLIDKNGQIVVGGFDAATRIIPLKHNRYKIERAEHNFHVIDANGQVLIPQFVCYEIISSNENYIFYKDYNMMMQYWSAQPFMLPKKTVLISANPQSEILLLQKGKKFFFYSIKTGMILGKPVANIVCLENEGYIFQNGEGLKGLVSYQGDTLLAAKFNEIKFNDRDWGIAYVGWKDFLLIDQKGQPIYPQLFQKMTAVSDYFLIQDTVGTGLMNADAKFVLPCAYQSIEEYNSDFYKTTRNGKIIYYTKSGTEVCTVEKEVLKGTPLTGWVITKNKQQYFYDGYINPRLNFETIIPVSSDGYVLQEKVRVGLYSNTGDTVVPPLYHELRADRDLFQVRFFNSYGYFDKNGKSYFNPMTGR